MRNIKMMLLGMIIVKISLIFSLYGIIFALAGLFVFLVYMFKEKDPKYQSLKMVLLGILFLETFPSLFVGYALAPLGLFLALLFIFKKDEEADAGEEEAGE